MNFVEPIRDPKKVEEICNYLKKENERNYVMFMLGIYTGLRISDILNRKIEDVKGKSQITLIEEKTKKQKIIKINPILKKALQEYCSDKDPDDYIIKSRKGYNAPISRIMAYKILKDIGDKFNIENLGTHTLRKTFGYHFYKQTKDAMTLKEIFNHSHISVTLRYIGVNQESINDAMINFKY